MKNCLTMTLLALMVLPLCQADAQKFQGGLSFLLGVPKGEFRKNMNNTGYGISGEIGFAPQKNPYMIGIDVSFMNYGMEERQEPFSTTIPDVTVNVESQNNIVLSHLFLRLQPNTGSVRPYLEGAVGLKYLFTQTTIKNQGHANEEIASSTNLDDIAFSYGGGAGIMVRLFRSNDDEDRKLPFRFSDALLDIRVRYLAGAEAEYLKEGSIRREAGRVVYDVQTSKTELMGIHIGLAVTF
ncbi:MAG: hypothetical protein V1799_17070 [bacterium]